MILDEHHLDRKYVAAKQEEITNYPTMQWLWHWYIALDSDCFRAHWELERMQREAARGHYYA